MTSTAATLQELTAKLPLLEVEYLDFEYTLPYTQAVIDTLASSVLPIGPGSRVLAVWPDDLTRYALARLGYALDVWLPPAGSMREAEGAAVSAKSLLDGSELPDGTAYDAILLNCVVEYLDGPITAALQIVAERLAPGGILLVTTRQAGRLSLRLRALFGRDYSPNPYLMAHSDLPRGWNSSVARRYYYADEICEAGTVAGLSAVNIHHVEGFTSWNGNHLSTPRSYLKRLILHAARRVVPSVREFVFVSLQRIPQIEKELAQDRYQQLPILPTQPFVSIVVSMCEAQVLRDLLVTLLEQSYPHDCYEVIIVDDSSSDDIAAVVASAKAESPVLLKLYCKERESPAASRNYGIARAQGDIVGFTDSDCLADRFWIESAVARFSEDTAMVAGRTEPRDNLHHPVGFFSHTVAPLLENGPPYPVANIFCRKDVLGAVGGFDPRFGLRLWGTTVAGDDTDLAWRVREAGYRYLFASDVLVSHQATPMGVREWLLAALQAQIVPAIVRRHPQLRREGLLWRVFLSPASALFYPVLLGIVLGVLQSPIWLCLGAPWLFLMRGFVSDDMRTVRRWHKIVPKLGFLFVRTMIQTIVLWWSSIRHQELVL